jgi:hypothetical protein
MQQEDGDSKSGGEGHHRSLSDNEDEDELIDMDDCMSGDED